MLAYRKPLALAGALSALWILVVCPALYGQSTENIIILVIDGPRDTEFLEDSTHANIPHIWNELRPQGCVSHVFFNNGITSTVPGHASLGCGVYQDLANDGSERPTRPLLWEYLRDQTGLEAEKASITTHKSKLRALSYSTFPGFGPPDSALVVGPTGSDSLAMELFYQHAEQDMPTLALIALAEVDARAHEGDWDAYLAAIQKADSLAADLWSWIESSPNYAGVTTFIITADHGRHDYDWTSHCDGCDGCRHIPLIALGPDFLSGYEDWNIPGEQIDLCRTCAYLLDLSIPWSEGRILTEFFFEPPLPPQAPTLAISVSASAVSLTWNEVTHDTGSNPLYGVTYLIYRGSLAWYPAVPDSLAGYEVTATSFVDFVPYAIGNSNLNYFYTVRAVHRGSNLSAESNRVGEVDLRLP